MRYLLPIFCLIAFSPVAMAKANVSCFQSRSHLTVQLSIGADSKDLCITFAEASEDEFQLKDFMSNANIGPAEFSHMIEKQELNVTAYPDGRPDSTGRSLRVSIKGNQASLMDDGQTYLFDSCSWMK